LSQILAANTDFVRVSTLAAGRTTMVLLMALAAAAIITPAMLLLIPSFGIRGAAAATLVGGLARLVMEQHVARRSIRINLPWLRVAVMAGLAGACWVAGSLAAGSGALLVTVAIKSCLLISFPAIVWVLPLLTPDERGTARLLLTEALRMLRSPHASRV
jgi:O-antigen/teichoic acid export membrane protein